MQTICQLNQKSTDIIMDRVQHLLEVIQLLGHLVMFLILLGDNANQECNIITKPFLYIINGELSVLHNIMQECCNDRICP